MSWLALLIIGAVILIVGMFIPGPAPLPMILRFLGGFLMLLGVIFLVIGLVAPASTVHTDVGASYSLTG